MRDTMVMLFHTRDAADKFCDILKDHGVALDAMTIIEPDDLPQYGRGEHAVGVEDRVEGFLDKLGSLFGIGGVDRDRYHNLADVLEDKGLDRVDADYYENEVRSGSTMLCVRAGDRYDEIKDLAEQGVVSSAARDDTDIFSAGLSDRRMMTTGAPLAEGRNLDDEFPGYEVINEETVVYPEPDADIRGDIGRSDTDVPLLDQSDILFDKKDYPIGGVGKAEVQPIRGRLIGHDQGMTIDRNVDVGYRSDVSELGGGRSDAGIGDVGIPPSLRDRDTDIGGALDLGNIGMTPGFDDEVQRRPVANLGETEQVPPGAESRPVRPSEELDDLRRDRTDEEDEYRERPAA